MDKDTKSTQNGLSSFEKAVFSWQFQGLQGCDNVKLEFSSAILTGLKGMLLDRENDRIAGYIGIVAKALSFGHLDSAPLW